MQRSCRSAKVWINCDGKAAVTPSEGISTVSAAWVYASDLNPQTVCKKGKNLDLKVYYPSISREGRLLIWGKRGRCSPLPNTTKGGLPHTPRETRSAIQCYITVPKQNCSPNRRAVKRQCFPIRNSILHYTHAQFLHIQYRTHMCSAYQFHYSPQCSTVPKPALGSQKAATSYTPFQQNSTRLQTRL